jgi:alpha-1,2-mannosyltransferase
MAALSPAAAANAPRGAGALTARQRTALVTVCVLYAAVVVPVGIHKGGDFVQEVRLADRWVSGLDPLFAGSPGKGTFWPPFTIFALAPFALVARLSLAVSQGLWAVLNVALLAWSAVTLARLRGWRPVLVGIAAVAKPLQGNFEHQNLLVVLLALIVAAARDIEAGHDARAGFWIGVATATKMFPGLLIVYFAARRLWRAALAAAVATIALTYLPMLRYGLGGAVRQIGDWIAVGRQGTPDFRYQPLGGWVIGLGGSAVAVWIALAVCVAVVFAAIVRRPAAGRDGVEEIGLVSVLAVLVSPVGWFYYHLLAIPTWAASLAQRPPAGRRTRASWRAALIVAGVLLSGILTFDHFIPGPLLVIKRFNYVWGALVLLGAIVARRLFTRPPRESSP